jgi:hypothetical protein
MIKLLGRLQGERPKRIESDSPWSGCSSHCDAITMVMLVLIVLSNIHLVMIVLIVLSNIHLVMLVLIVLSNIHLVLASTQVPVC